MEQWMTKLAEDLKDQWRVEAEEAARNDLAEHTGWTTNMRVSNPLSWLSVLRGPNQVDEEWLASKHNEKLDSATPEQTKWNTAYSRELHRASQEARDNAIRKDTAALHVGSKISDNSAVGIVDSALGMVPGLGWKGWAHRATGQTAEELLQDYKRQVEDQLGEDAAKKAENRLRRGGNIAGLTSAVSTAAAMGAAAGPANAAKPMSGAAKAWSGLSASGGKLGYASNVLQGAARTYGWTKPIGSTLKTFADQVTNGGQDIEGNPLSGIAAKANAVGNFAESIPKYQLAMGALNPVVSRTLGAAGKIPVLGIPFRAASGLWRYANTPNTYSGIGGFLNSGLKSSTTMTVIPPIMNTVSMATNALQGKETPPQYWGLGETALGAIEATADTSDTMFPYLNAGDSSVEYRERERGILNGPGDPIYEHTVNEMQEHGVQLPENATPDQIRDLYKSSRIDSRRKAVAEDILFNLDENVDSWNGLTPEEIQAKVDAFPPEQRREAKKRAYLWQMSRGGPQSFSDIFSDSDLDWDDKRSLLSDLLMAEDKLNGGFSSSLPGQVGRYLLSGAGDIAGSAAEVSPVAQEAIMEYTKSMCKAMKHDPAKMKKYLAPLRGSERLRNALSYDQWKEALQPVVDATAAEQFNIVDALGSIGGGKGDEIVGMVKDMCLMRMVKDDKYAADMLYEVARRNSDSKLPDETVKPFAEVFLHKDPKKLFDGMSVRQYDTVTRWLMSNDGNGFLSTLPPERQEAIKGAYTQAAQNRARSLLKENPFNIQVLSSLWAHSKGYDSVAKFLGDPVMFWGTATLLLTGLFLIGTMAFSGRGDRDDKRLEDKMDSLKDEMDRQRKLMSPVPQPVQAYDPYSYYQNI